MSAEGARIDTFADGVGRDLVDDSGSRWTYIGRAGSAEAAKRDPKWLNVTMAEFETLNTQEKAEFLRPEMMLRGHVYRMADESLSTGVPIDRPLEVVEPSLPEGSTEPMPSVFLRQTKVIFDTDSRSDASGSSHLFPWNTIGTVRTATGQGTGFKVLNHHTFVTAGHNFASPPTASNWSAGPAVITMGDRPWSPPFAGFGATGTWAANPVCYAVNRPTNFTWENALTDFAVLKLRDTGLGIACPFNLYNTGFLGKSYGFSDPQWIIGYGTPPSSLSWNSLLYHGGDVFARNSDRQINTDVIDATPGQSGSPWIWVDGSGNWYATGVYTRSWTEAFWDEENQGPAVYSNIWNLIVGWGGN